MNKCNIPQFNEIKMPLMCVEIKELIGVVIERSPESHMTRSLCCSVSVGPQETEKDVRLCPLPRPPSHQETKTELI